MSTTEEPTPAPESEGQPEPQAAEENLIPESTFDPATGQQLPVEVPDQEESEATDSEAEDEDEEEDADE